MIIVMSLKLEEFQLLQRIAENTNPLKTSMISITSTNPQFSVNFPCPIPVKEIALAKLRIYHSWPNNRSVAFGGRHPIIPWCSRIRIDPMALQTGTLFPYQLDHTKLNKSIVNCNVE